MAKLYVGCCSIHLDMQFLTVSYKPFYQPVNRIIQSMTFSKNLSIFLQTPFQYIFFIIQDLELQFHIIQGELT